MKKTIYVVFISLLMAVVAQAQVLFTETFNYSNGSLDVGNSITPGNNVSGGNWVFSGSSSSALNNLIQVSGTGLAYSTVGGNDLSGVGKMVTLSNQPDDASQDRCYRQFTTQTGKVYYSLLLNVTDLIGIPSVGASKGDYFVVLWPSTSTTNSNSFGALSIRMSDSVSRKFQLGIRPFQTAATAKWYETGLDSQKVYHIVVSYDCATDSMKMWVNPGLTTTEPASQIDTLSSVDKTQIARLGFYQRQTGPHCQISGVRVGVTWQDVIFPASISETFNYAIGGLDAGSALSPRMNVSKSVWICGTSSAFTDSLSVESGALTYTGYSLSGIDNKLYLPNDLAATSNDRAYRNFYPTTSKVYYSLMANLKEVTNLSAYPSTNGEYFFGFWPSNSSSNANFRGVLCIRAGSTIGTYQLGIRAIQATGNAPTSWVAIDMNTNTTYLVMVSYQLGTLPTAKLWVNPVLNGTEPVASATSTAVSNITENIDIGRIGIYMRGSKPHIWLGGIKTAKSWAESAGQVQVPFKAIPEGYYDQVTDKLNCRDTVKVYLADINSPYTIIDSATTVIDSLTFSGSACFKSSSAGRNYLVISGRNIVQTWSRNGGENFILGENAEYDFTNEQSQAYGSNLVQKGARWCIYSGDVNQDGFVDFSDLTSIDNDSYNFLAGYNPTDLNGDQFVDFSDLTICDNNSYNFIGVVKPGQKANGVSDRKHRK